MLVAVARVVALTKSLRLVGVEVLGDRIAAVGGRYSAEGPDHDPNRTAWNGPITATASGSSSVVAVLKPVKLSIATTSTGYAGMSPVRRATA
jgi:hypothetical protein